jgi:hypothetical protein
VTDGYTPVIDRQEIRRLPRPFDKGAERDRFTSARRIHIDAVERSLRALQLGQNLHHHVIAVELSEILRHLPLPERVVERVVDQLRLDAEACRPIAVDGQGQGRTAGLLIARDVAQLGQRLELVEDLRRPSVQLVEIGVLQSVLVLRPRRAPADVDVLRRLQKQCRAFDIGELRTQSPDERLETLAARAKGWRFLFISL